MNKSHKHIVIIGNGISGVTCARYIRKNDEGVSITIVSGETEHFFSRTALMYIYMGHMKYEHTKPYEDWFWEKNRLDLVKGWVEKVDFGNKKLNFQNGKTLDYDVLILATGSKPNKFGWPGQDSIGVQGLYSYQDLESMEKHTQNINRAVIVGGGLIGIEMAEMLKSRDIPVTFLVREKNFWDNILPFEESQMINRHIKEHHIDLRLETELHEIIPDESGRVKAISTKTGEVIVCQFVGLTAGVSPNVDFLKNNPVEENEPSLQIQRGILVNAYFETNIPDIYAIGDCAEFQEALASDRKNIEQVWYTGRMHGETLAHNLTHQKSVSYQPGIWFNSAKFLDIEYQTYGHVPPFWDEYIGSFYWEHQGGKACLRILYQKSDMAIVGVNAFGWRLRHEFFDKAITDGWKLEKVMVNLNKANFNPEFFEAFHRDVLKKYNQETGKQLKVGKTSFLKKLIGSRA
ncbi:NAD(P)/FAD-dependent oxidoreductase [Aquiflexum lacus]|uniref:NAD(P)/FAD-dependent oxidoreductase n=1 Tax=Aquiflexum lacus TaxID=2483805 RepID=UPI001895F739|nr:FAD/NAD(P)-binding oxidoreductase [Aquiflexum lacus]